MKGNLEARVEILAPVEAPELKKELADIFLLHDSDRRSIWDMQPDGSYLQRKPPNDNKGRGSQQLLIACAERRSKAFRKEKKIRM